MELKPCPFCGGEAQNNSFVETIPEIDENGAYIDYSEMIYHEETGCPSCDIWFYIGEDEPEGITIERWNRRKADV